MNQPRRTPESAGLFLAAACCVALLAWQEGRQGPAAELVLQPVAPPLTRIASLGDAPLLPEGTTVGPLPPPPQGDRTAEHPAARHPPGPNRNDAGGTNLGHVLRIQVEADAIALAELLGRDRVQTAVAHRESLSALLGESRTWDDLLVELESRAAEASP